MTIRRRTEAIENEDGRYRTAVQEREPVDRHEMLSEEQVTSVTSDSWSVARGWIRVIVLWIAVALAAIETLIAFRLGFLLAGANPTNGFVDFVYDFSDPFVEPFQGIIANEAVDGGIFEPASLIGMVVYLVAAALLMAAILVITSGPSARGDRVVTSRTRRREDAAHGR